ncbi:MAG: hypothetical protein QM301_12055 [Bacteroidota bacterium]|nr:hypothetical protein [Bacteroidota bacterium]
MDYLYVGSNGFAQVGQQDFHIKNRAEMAVLMNYLETYHPIPEEFYGMCCYKVKWFHHDFGDYSEIVLVYNDRLLAEWETSDPEKLNRFWTWYNLVETVDLESDALTDEIESLYFKMTHDDDLSPVKHESKAR